jgi:arginine deiminase
VAAKVRPQARAHARLRVEGELGWLRRVLVCSPGEEIRRVPPAERDRYLVEDFLWLPRAQEQHAAFVRALSILMRAAPRDPGDPEPEVVDLRVELSRALADPGTADAAGALLEEVCRLEPRLAGPEMEEEVAALRAELERGSTRLGDDLIAGVLEPQLAPGRELFRVCPSPNIVFARDYQFVLGGGAFISSMAKPVRRKEPALARFLFDHALGLGGVSFDVRSLSGSARARRRALAGSGELLIEGGDVMALDRRTVLVGVSERTSLRGASALALGLRWLRRQHPDEFPFTELCAVEMPPKRAMMHLDTVFTLVDRGLALAYPPLTFPGAREEMPVLSCDLAEDPDAPLAFRHAGPFSEAMAQRLSSPGRPFTMIAGGGRDRIFQHREQWCDACNAVAVGPGVAVSYDRNDRTLAALAALDQPGSALVVTPGHRRTPAAHLRPFQVLHAADLTPRKARALVASGERVMVCIDGGELGRARGGPHCMTMALVRATEEA